MADSFFGFDTSVSNINDDDGGGGDGSEDEYDALNDETFGPAGDFDWEVEHELHAEQMESSRRHKSSFDDSQSQLEASLSQLVLDEIDPALSSTLTSSVWRHDPPPPPPPQYHQQQQYQQRQQHLGNAGAPPLKSVHTVEELERQLRQAPAPHANQNFFQPRFPPVILQRPPGLQAPVPLPYAPPPMMGQPTNMGQPPYQYPNQMGMGQHPSQMPNMGQHANQMMGNLNQPGGQLMGSMGNMSQLVQNGGSHFANQYHGAQMGQMGQRMMPPPGLGMPRQPFNPNMGQYNNNFRPQTKPMPEQQMPPPPQQNQNIMNQLMNPMMQSMKPPSPKPQQQPNNNHIMQPKQQQKPRVVYNSNQKITSENLVHYIQNTHPMLQMGVPNSLNNANHHPMLNRGAGFKGTNQFGNQRMNGNFYNSSGSNGSDEAGGDGGDEYAGLMSAREKQWLVNIQMLQLNTGTPYIDDFYYTVFLERKSKKEKENVKEAHTANQRNHPFYSGGVKQEQHRERHNSSRLGSQGEEAAPRAYVPAQFENSLGKLQCGSVTAPRKIIDVELVQGEAGGTRPSSVASVTNPHEVPREVRRTKQLLLDVEALYPLLLRLEEMSDPLAISNALILKEREEKAAQAQAEASAQQPPAEDNVFLRSVEAVRRRAESKPDVVDKRQVVSLAPPPASQPALATAANLLDEDRATLLGRLFAGVARDERARDFLTCRKGKHLLARLLSRAPTHPRARSVWARVLRALPHAARRDDGSLAALCPPFQLYVAGGAGWSCVLDAAAHLAEAVDPARPPHALTAPLTLSCVCTLVEKACTLVNTPDATPSERQWSKFLKTFARALKNATVAVARPLNPLDEPKLVCHLKQLDSRATIEILQRGKTIADTEMTKSEVCDTLVKYLC